MKYDILVIDDDEGVRKLFFTILQKHKCMVSAAESGTEALELLRKNTYRLILLDLKMPKMDGTETFREIRKLDAHVPVYFITAFQNAYLKELKRLKAEGMQFQIFKKPIEKEKLLMVVDDLLINKLPAEELNLQLRLYITGKTKRTEDTINRLHDIFQNEWQGQYSLEIIDVIENPHIAEQDRIIATPTLAKISPGPSKRLIGDFSIGDVVLRALSLAS